jgi:hypothetical protein
MALVAILFNNKESSFPFRMATRAIPTFSTLDFQNSLFHGQPQTTHV